MVPLDRSRAGANSRECGHPKPIRWLNVAAVSADEGSGAGVAEGAVLMAGEAVPGANVGRRPLPDGLATRLRDESNTTEVRVKAENIEAGQRQNQ